MAADRIRRRLAAILAADVVGYASDVAGGDPTPYPLRSMLGGWSMLRLFAAIIVALGASGVADASPLFEAAGRGDLAVVEKLLGEGVEVDQRARNAETPLIAAALAGETATAEVFDRPRR